MSSRNLFAQGDWDTLAGQLAFICDSNAADGLAIFRFGNLKFHLGKYSEALEYFERALLNAWPGALCLNNKGVALIRTNDTRAGLTALLHAIDCDKRYAPAWFNLGMAFQVFADSDKPLPPAIHEVCGNIVKGTPTEAMRECFRQAASSSWPAIAKDGELEAPLLLWRDEFASGFGFEPKIETAELLDAHGLFNRGLDCVRNQEWENGLEFFRKAVILYPNLEDRVAPERTRAQVAICRKYRQMAFERLHAGDPIQATQYLDALFDFIPVLPDRALVHDILIEQIHALGRDLRTKPLDADWESLLRLTAAVEEKIEQFGRKFGADAKAELAKELGEVCRDAWWVQISELLQAGSLAEAATVAEVSANLWFAKDILSTIRGQVFGTMARRRLAEAEIARTHNRKKEAEALFSEAAAAARKADDPALVAYCQQRFQLFNPPSAAGLDKDALRKKLAEEKFDEALADAYEGLKAKSSDIDLQNLYNYILGRILSEIEYSGECGLWDRTEHFLKLYEKFGQNSDPSRKWLPKIKRGKADHIWKQAFHEYTTGDHKTANALCDQALAECPGHRDSLDLKRRMEAQRLTSSGKSSAKYDEAHKRFCAAQTDSDIVAAFDAALDMWTLDEKSEISVKAIDWAFAEYVDYVLRQLKLRRSAGEPDNVRNRLDTISRLRVDGVDSARLADARKLAREVLDQSRHDISVKLLEEARSHLNAKKPKEALRCIDDVLAFGEPAGDLDVASVRDEILGQLRAGIEANLRHADNTALNKAEDLANTLRRWDPALAAAFDARIGDARTTQQMLEARRERERQRDKQFDALLREVRDQIGSDVTAASTKLRAGVVRIQSQFEPLSALQRKEAATLRARIRSAQTSPTFKDQVAAWGLGGFFKRIFGR